jgi:hypothetical protein
MNVVSAAVITVDSTVSDYIFTMILKDKPGRKD